MKNIAAIAVLMFFQFSIFGQIGVGVGYKNFNAEEWEKEINQSYNYGFSNPTGYSFSVDYRLRIKNIRIEFFPELSYSYLKNDYENSTLEYTLYGFHLNTNVYLFDLEGDCDCPTWSKSGNIFQKGFFLQAAPGINNLNILFDHVTQIDKQNDYFWDIGIGAGLDIGISKFLTVTPNIKYFFAPNAKWVHLEPLDGSELTTKSNAGQFYAGIRLGFHFKK